MYSKTNNSRIMHHLYALVNPKTANATSITYLRRCL